VKYELRRDQSIDTPELRMRLIYTTITVTEAMTAIIRPITTRGIGATLSRSTKAIVSPEQTSLEIAKKVEKTSAPLDLYGRKTTSETTIKPSRITTRMIWASPLFFPAEIKIAFRKDATRNGVEK
jgi:hypothetical protein